MIKTKELPKMRDEEVSHFWGMVDVKEVSSCWNWKHAKNLQGYGFLKIYGVKHASHRIAWFLFNKIQPGDFLVCHSCDNPSCCNPYHLFLGTARDNYLDCEKKGRTNPVKGEEHWNHKLTIQQVEEIKRMKTLGYSQGYIADTFGVNQCHISRILTGKRRA